MSFESDFAKMFFANVVKTVEEREAQLIEKGRQQAFDEVRKAMDSVKDKQQTNRDDWPFEIELRCENKESHDEYGQVVSFYQINHMQKINSRHFVNCKNVRINGTWFCAVDKESDLSKQLEYKWNSLK